MTNEERETLVDIKKAAETGLSCISCGNNGVVQLWEIVGMCDAALCAEAAEAHKEYAIADIMRSSREFYFHMEFDKWLFAPGGDK